MISAKDVNELRKTTGAGMMACKQALEATNGDMEKAMDWLREKGIAKANKKESRIAAEGLSSIFVDGNKAVIIEVNSETDFVSKNDEFKNMINNIGNTIIKSDVTNLEDALNLKYEDGTIADYVVNMTAKIGEKLSLRRLEVINKTDNDAFGSYLHMGGKIAVLTVVSDTNSEVAKDVAMQAAAMKPQYTFESDVPEDVVNKEKETLKQEAMNEGKPAEIAEKMVIGRLKKFFKDICLEDQEFIKDNSVDVKTYVKNNGGKLVKMVRYEVGEGIEKRVENFAEEVMNQVNSTK